MRAKKVYEFVRGSDPKETIGIGRVGTIRKFFRDLGIPDEKYEITEDEIIFIGSLNLIKTNITYLPNNLTVTENLNICDTNISELPIGLNATNLYATDAKIKNIPNDIFIMESLKLTNCPIEYLPDNLQLKGWLSLIGTKLTKLPENLSIGNDLYLNRTKIVELPNSLKVERLIYVNDKQHDLINFINKQAKYNLKIYNL